MNCLKTRWFGACLSAALFLVVLPSSQAAGFDSDFEDEQKPWQEVAVQLPAFPEPVNLLPFTVGAVQDTRFLIDGNSLSVGADEVIRYTLVVISPSGAQTISYEGMRCTTAERRVYAFGRSDKTWSKARGNKWTQIKGNTNNHHVSLFGDYLCAMGAPTVMTADAARRVLRNGGPNAGPRP